MLQCEALMLICERNVHRRRIFAGMPKGTRTLHSRIWEPPVDPNLSKVALLPSGVHEFSSATPNVPVLNSWQGSPGTPTTSFSVTFARASSPRMLTCNGVSPIASTCSCPLFPNVRRELIARVFLISFFPGSHVDSSSRVEEN